MTVMENVLRVLDDALHLQGRALDFKADTPLLGSLPELDSMGALAVITALEQHFDLVFHDEDLNADTFATVQRLCDLVASAQT